MPITYHIDRSRSLIRTTCTGPVLYDEVVRHFVILAQEPRLPDRLDVLLDVTAVTSVPATQHLRGVAETMESLRDRLRFGVCAVVADGDMAFSIARLFTAFARDQFDATTVVHAIAEAEQWLLSVKRPSARVK